MSFGHEIVYLSTDCGRMMNTLFALLYVGISDDEFLHMHDDFELSQHHTFDQLDELNFNKFKYSDNI